MLGVALGALLQERCAPAGERTVQGTGRLKNVACVERLNEGKDGVCLEKRRLRGDLIEYAKRKVIKLFPRPPGIRGRVIGFNFSKGVLG